MYKHKFRYKKKYTLRRSNKKYTVKPIYPEEYDKFTKLLNDTKELKELVERLVFIRLKYPFTSYISRLNIYERFIEKCHELNINEYEYPFNTKDKYKESLYRYIDSLIEAYFNNYSTKKYTN